MSTEQAMVVVDDDQLKSNYSVPTAQSPRVFLCAIVLTILVGALSIAFGKREQAESVDAVEKKRLKQLQLDVRPFIASLVETLRTTEAIAQNSFDTKYFPDHVKVMDDLSKEANLACQATIPPLLEAARQISAGDLSADTLAEYESRKAAYLQKEKEDKPIREAWVKMLSSYVNSKFPLLAIDVLRFVDEEHSIVSKEHDSVVSWVARHYSKASMFAHDVRRAVKEYGDAHSTRLAALLAIRNTARRVADGDLHQLRFLKSVLENYDRSVELNDKAVRTILTPFPVGVRNMDFIDQMSRASVLADGNEKIINGIEADFPFPEDRRCRRQIATWIKTIDDKLDPKNLGVSFAAYRKMQQGMEYFNVCEYIGEYGESQSEAGNLTTYAWRNGFRLIVATFRGGRLVSKSQTGL